MKNLITQTDSIFLTDNAFDALRIYLKAMMKSQKQRSSFLDECIWESRINTCQRYMNNEFINPNRFNYSVDFPLNRSKNVLDKTIYCH